MSRCTRASSLPFLLSVYFPYTPPITLQLSGHDRACTLPLSCCYYPIITLQISLALPSHYLATTTTLVYLVVTLALSCDHDTILSMPSRYLSITSPLLLNYPDSAMHVITLPIPFHCLPVILGKLYRYLWPGSLIVRYLSLSTPQLVLDQSHLHPTTCMSTP